MTPGNEVAQLPGVGGPLSTLGRQRPLCTLCASVCTQCHKRNRVTTATASPSAPALCQARPTPGSAAPHGNRRGRCPPLHVTQDPRRCAAARGTRQRRDATPPPGATAPADQRAGRARSGSFAVSAVIAGRSLFLISSDTGFALIHSHCKFQTRMTPEVRPDHLLASIPFSEAT